MIYPRQRGSTQNIIRVFVPDNSVTNGAGVASLSSSSTNLAVAWQRTLGTKTTYSGANIASCTPGTWADAGSGKIGFAAVDSTVFQGLYELQFSDTGSLAFGSQDTSDTIIVNIYESGASSLHIGPNMVLIPLVPWNYQDGVRMGLTGLANAVPGAANGLLICGTNSPVTITGTGNALALVSTGGNGSGLAATGNGTGDGATLTGGAGAGGDGLQATAGGGVDIRGAITGNVTGNVSGSVGSVSGSVGSIAAGGIASTSFATDSITAAAIAADAGAEIADALLDRNMATGVDSGSPSVRTVRQALRMLRNKFTISATTLTVTKEDDTATSWTSTITTDATAVPIVTSDPA